MFRIVWTPLEPWAQDAGGRSLQEPGRESLCGWRGWRWASRRPREPERPVSAVTGKRLSLCCLFTPQSTRAPFMCLPAGMADPSPSTLPSAPCTPALVWTEVRGEASRDHVNKPGVPAGGAELLLGRCRGSKSRAPES